MIDWIEIHSQAWKLIQADLMQNRLSHALLLAGPAGIGKLQFAEELAAGLLCDSPLPNGRACRACTSCTWHLSGNHPDFRRLRPEAYSDDFQDDEDGKASAVSKSERKKSEQIRIDQVRALESFIQVGSHRGKRVILIEPAEAMNEATANALLKSLEEPPSGVHFLLVSHAAERLLPTVRSRTRIVSIQVPNQSIALSQLGSLSPPLKQSTLWLNRCAGALRFALQLSKAAEKHADATEEAIAEVGIVNVLLMQLPLGKLMDPIGLAKSCEPLIKGDQAGMRLAFLIDWLQRWALDLHLVRLGSSPLIFPELATAFEKLSEQINDEVLAFYPDFLIESRLLSSHPLNLRLFLESIFSRTVALYTR